MKHTKEEILNALQIIKDECKCIPRGACRICPFSHNGSECTIQKFVPEDWQIKMEKDSEWKAFEK